MVDPEILNYYNVGKEAQRLSGPYGELERVRTQEITERLFPRPPASILDVGGGTGPYTQWLADRGYDAHLLDPIPLHIEQARRAGIGNATVGDARDLAFDTASFDALLMLGPLYHLTTAKDRAAALREAYRVLRPGGVLVAAGISRFASLLDGLWRNLIDDVRFRSIVDRDLREGQHRNPGGPWDYFTTAYFHHPQELRAEVEQAGFDRVGVVAVEGPAWLLPDLSAHWNDSEKRSRLLSYLRRIDSDASLLGQSAHLIVTGKKLL